MEKPLRYDEADINVSTSMVDKIYGGFSDGLHFATPSSSLRTNEVDLVRGVLQMLQGLSSSLLNWDQGKKCFCATSGIYVTHLSRTSLHAILSQFSYAATCLKLVDLIVDRVKTSSRSSPPTLRAFVCSVSSWIVRLRQIALKEEIQMSNSNSGMTPTLLGLASSLSSLCSGAEYLLEVVHGTIPLAYFEPMSSITASEVAVHILDSLYKRLDEACLVQGGEEEAYQMLLYLFVGSVLPYIEGLDSWLYEGILDDPFEEIFFYANKDVTVEDADFWDRSYLLRLAQDCKLDAQQSVVNNSKDRVPLTGDRKETMERELNPGSLKAREWSDRDRQVCPMFIKDISKSIVSAGKSFQLIQHVPTISFDARRSNYETDALGGYVNLNGLNKIYWRQSMAGLTLSETFSVSLAGLIGHVDELSRYFQQIKVGTGEEALPSSYLSEKTWFKLLMNTVSQRKEIYCDTRVASDVLNVEHHIIGSEVIDDELSVGSFCPENPVLTVCHKRLAKNVDAWKWLNLSKCYHLPPLNDEVLWKAIFGEESGHTRGTDFAFKFSFGQFEYQHAQNDTKLLEGLFPFPTLLPSFQDDIHMSGLLPFQRNSTLPSRMLGWIQHVEPRSTPLPLAILQECIVVYIEKQVDYIGKQILLKLMHDWRLMDELAVLRAIYLLGSGDLLQHFLTVIFNKLDRGEKCDDDFELNTLLQESIRNSADGNLLTTPDSLIVSISRSQGSNNDEQNTRMAFVSTPRKISVQNFGIDGLDSLNFSYKVSWPLELIANAEAIKKYNQVMGFLLKVKRAKFVLDKARRWMWKGKGIASYSCKHHWLVEQKLLHFVDAFHQYVMDRVYHSAWRELCEGMATARSLDEVMEVHEAYLLSIQRQCFVVPDKLWALIASRINSILSLALDFYSVQQTLSSGGAIPTIKARCEMEVERIEKQFDDCIAFLLRVLSFKLNVGNFPHLADLVTRINYNYFYMSDGGNLKTRTGTESVASRFGKAPSGGAE
ncbi:Gamma-tubulin complex component [Psidium guajava]|nr:Gamma-tubulin complex component [Psidium guajava]